MPLTLFLVRHAQSQNNALPESERVSDPPLTELGLHQARKLADRLEREAQANGNPDIMLCSPFLRTLQTLQPTAQRISMQAMIRSNLFEAGGCYEGYIRGSTTAAPGMGRSEITELFPEFVIPTDISNKGWYTLPDFEEWDEASERARELSRQLLDEFYGKSQMVLCMIHGDLISLLLGHYCEGNTVLAETCVSNTSVTCLRFESQSAPPMVVCHNDAAHLEANEISH